MEATLSVVGIYVLTYAVSIVFGWLTINPFVRILSWHHLDRSVQLSRSFSPHHSIILSRVVSHRLLSSPLRQADHNSHYALALRRTRCLLLS